MKKSAIFILFLLLALFLDDRLSFLLSSLSSNFLHFSTSLTLLVIFYLGLSTSGLIYYPLLICLGFVYDSYHFGLPRFTLFLFPLFFFVFRLLAPLLLQGFWERFLSFLMLTVVFSFALYGLGLLTGLTTYPMTQLVTYNIAPSLVLNALILFLLQRQCDIVFLEI